MKLSLKKLFQKSDIVSLFIIKVIILRNAQIVKEELLRSCYLYILSKRVSAPFF